MRSGKPNTDKAMSRKGRYHQVRENLRIKEIVVGDGEGRKRYVLVHNPQEEKRQQVKRQQLPNETHTKAACKLRPHGAYGKYLRQLKDGTLKLNKEATREAGRYDGKYLIRTSDDTLPVEDVALEERIRAHVTISWLALLLVRMAEVKTGLKWARIRNEHERLHIGHFSSNNGDVYKTTQPSQKQLEILKALGLKPPPELFDIKPVT
jgi:hypothetical protein